MAATADPAFEADDRVASLSEILDAYERCLDVVGHADALLDHLEDVSLVSINSEIAAARSQVNQEVFMVLSGESARIARAMEGAISSILSGSDIIITMSMRGILGARQYEQLGLAIGERPDEELTPLMQENFALIDRVRNETAGNLHDAQKSMSGALHTMHGDRHSLERLNRKFETLATYFRIEASRDTVMGGFFLTIADLLDQLHHQIHAVLTRMGITRRNEALASRNSQEAA